MKSWLFGAACSLGLFACGGRVLVDGTGQGEGGQGGASDVTTSVGDVTSSVVGQVVAATGTFSANAGSGGGSCLRCAEFVISGGNTTELCPDSIGLYKSLYSCSCDLLLCATACGNSLCANAPLTAACRDCILSTSKGCDVELNGCANDI